MPFYLSEYIGSGTKADPFRPVGSDQPGWSAIDLRADNNLTAGGPGGLLAVGDYEFFYNFSVSGQVIRKGPFPFQIVG